MKYHNLARYIFTGKKWRSVSFERVAAKWVIFHTPYAPFKTVQQKDGLPGKKMPGAPGNELLGFRVGKVGGHKPHSLASSSTCQGRYELADRLDNHNSAPNEYISGEGGTKG